MDILVTGAASGIGLGVAQALHQAQHRVIGIDRHAITDKHIEWHRLDLNDLAQVQAYIDTELKTYDALIYCAGVREICNPLDLAFEQWQQVMNVNVNACFLFAQALIKKAINDKRAFNLVTMASISGLQVENDRLAYVSSKFALIGLTRQLAFQFAGQGIRANAIAPGVVETPLTADYFKDEVMVEKIKHNIPLGHWGKIENITPLVDICLNNSYMNGSVLVCDGGWTLGKNL